MQWLCACGPDTCSTRCGAVPLVDPGSVDAAMTRDLLQEHGLKAAGSTASLCFTFAFKRLQQSQNTCAEIWQLPSPPPPPPPRLRWESKLGVLRVQGLHPGQDLSSDSAEIRQEGLRVLKAALQLSPSPQ